MRLKKVNTFAQALINLKPCININFILDSFSFVPSSRAPSWGHSPRRRVSHLRPGPARRRPNSLDKGRNLTLLQDKEIGGTAILYRCVNMSAAIWTLSPGFVRRRSLLFWKIALLHTSLSWEERDRMKNYALSNCLRGGFQRTAHVWKKKFLTWVFLFPLVSWVGCAEKKSLAFPLCLSQKRIM